MKSKVLFRVDGNSLIGWGHFYRSLALAKMLVGNYTISFAMADPADSLKEIIQKNGFNMICLPPFKYSTPDERTGYMPFDLQKHAPEFDIVVLDGYWFGKEYCKELKKCTGFVVIIEDDGKGNFEADLVINHAPGLDPSNYNLSKPKASLALGPKYALLRPAFLNATSFKSPIKTKLEKAIVAFGGSDYYNLTKTTISWFIQNTSVELHVILGASYRFQNTLIDFINNERVNIYSGLSEVEMLKLLRSADFGVVPASGLLFEAIAVRLPIISGYYTDNQLNIFHGFKHLNVFVDSQRFSNYEMAWRELNSLDLRKIQEVQARIIDSHVQERYQNLFNSLS